MWRPSSNNSRFLFLLSLLDEFWWVLNCFDVSGRYAVAVELPGDEPSRSRAATELQNKKTESEQPEKKLEDSNNKEEKPKEDKKVEDDKEVKEEEKISHEEETTSDERKSKVQLEESKGEKVED